MVTPSQSKIQVLPWYYYYFFGGLEPVLEVIGAYLCIFTPEDYVKGLLPAKVERTTSALGASMRGRIATGILGSYFFTFSLLAFSFFPLVTRSLGDRPHVVERLTRGYLAILAICDIQHIVVTLLPMPASLLRSPDQWTVAIHGNISITIILFLVRALWFAGIGRDKHTPEKVEKTTSAGKEGYSLAGMSPGWYYLFAVIEPLLMTVGALYILVLPGDYGKSILPDRYERVTSLLGNTVRGQMVLGGLGSCLILTSLVQFTMFPLIRSTLRDDHDIARRLVSGMLAPLAICDILCAAVAFMPLPASLSDSPAKWTPVMYLNIVGRMIFLALRILFFLGGEPDEATSIGTVPPPKKAKKSGSVTGTETAKATGSDAGNKADTPKRRSKKIVE